MWFRNLRVFRFGEPVALSPEALEERLEQQRARPCGRFELVTHGWTPPLGRHGERLVHVGGSGRIMLCARKEEKVLPAAVIKEELEARVDAMEREQGRPVRRKEQRALRETVVEELLPRAFTRAVPTFGYIDPQRGWLLVDAAAARRAEEFVMLLRQSLGGAALTPLLTAEPPGSVMTRWLTEGVAEQGFELADECELREPGEQGGVMRCRHQDLTAEEIRVHLDAGKRAARLALEWSERVACVVDEELGIKRVRFLEGVLEQTDTEHYDVDDYVGRFDADFTITAAELDEFLHALLRAFGGENRD